MQKILYAVGFGKKAQQFAAENDIIIFTAGKKSSNGKVLHISHDVNPDIFAETKEDMDWNWYEGVVTVELQAPLQHHIG